MKAMGWIRFNCPVCESSAAPERYAGYHCQCHTCKSYLRVPIRTRRSFTTYATAFFLVVEAIWLVDWAVVKCRPTPVEPPVSKTQPEVQQKFDCESVPQSSAQDSTPQDNPTKQATKEVILELARLGLSLRGDPPEVIPLPPVAVQTPITPTPSAPTPTPTPTPTPILTPTVPTPTPTPTGPAPNSFGEMILADGRVFSVAKVSDGKWVIPAPPRIDIIAIQAPSPAPAPAQVVSNQAPRRVCVPATPYIPPSCRAR